jgi:NADPH:quinone reductase
VTFSGECKLTEIPRKWHNTMRAIVLRQFGEPASVLQCEKTPTPEPATGEVKVRMLASPVNPSELMVVRGTYGTLPELPATPGFEGVGIVESSNAGLLGRFLVGKRVAVLNRGGGSWREWTTAPARQVIPLGNDLPLEQCAMFFVNPATAYIMTCRVLCVPSGAWLLQTAAGSTLGKMVIRLGQHCGFRTLNVVRRDTQIDELKAIGADEVIAFDPKNDDTEQFCDKVRTAIGANGVPYAIDPVGGDTGSAVVQCLSKSGRMLVFGTLSDQPLEFSSRALMGPGAGIEGFWLGNWMDQQNLIGKLNLVSRIKKLLLAGILTSEVGTTYALDQIAEAVQDAERPARGGKTLLQIAPK